MNSNTLEHLKLIIAHLDKLLEQASKRTPGEWSHWPTHWAGGNNSTQYDGTNNCPWISSEQSPAFEVARINPKNIYRSVEPMANATFIASCAGNAEAGWRATKAAIAHILSGGRGHDNGEDLMAETILAAWPLELLETKP